MRVWLGAFECREPWVSRHEKHESDGEIPILTGLLEDRITAEERITAEPPHPTLGDPEMER